MADEEKKKTDDTKKKAKKKRMAANQAKKEALRVEKKRLDEMAENEISMRSGVHPFQMNTLTGQMTGAPKSIIDARADADASAAAAEKEKIRKYYINEAEKEKQKKIKEEGWSILRNNYLKYLNNPYWKIQYGRQIKLEGDEFIEWDKKNKIPGAPPIFPLDYNM